MIHDDICDIFIQLVKCMESSWIYGFPLVVVTEYNARQRESKIS